MIRLFEFRDLDRIMEIWLEGNLNAHPFIKEEYWRQHYETVCSVLPNAEVYVNAGAVAFYKAEGFPVENSMTEKVTGEQEYLMVFHESDETKE